MAPAPILCYVTDRGSLPAPQADSLLAAIRRAVAAGVDWIQIREKDLSGRALATLVREAVAAARGTPTRILINGRLDVAFAARAAGIHLGSDSFPVADVAAWCAKNPPRCAAQSRKEQDAGLPISSEQVPTGATQPFLIGASCHSLDDARAAARDGAHYIIFGPIFPTPSKLQYGPPLGLARLEKVCGAVQIPVLAIGGITLDNARECLRAGAAGLAAIRLFQDASDLPALVSSLRNV
ncbi:MAG: thiamine phosphate synthase [Acidobacteria bacterium]|nr:thiamine phosphate synthase [Acidobacteriota bacterium]MBI3663910.1 thiamine phosphate synthase [Acidobacteriota bacterium]